MVSVDLCWAGEKRGVVAYIPAVNCTRSVGFEGYSGINENGYAMN